MTAKAWQAWAAAVVVVLAMLGLPVLGELDGEPDRRAMPGRYYDYSAPRSALMETIVDGVMAPQVRIEPKGWTEYAPARADDLDVQLPGLDDPPAAPDPPEVTLRVTATGLAVDGGDEQTDDLAMALITIKHRVDPRLQLTIQIDEDVPYERVIHVMDAARSAGVEDVRLGVAP